MRKTIILGALAAAAFLTPRAHATLAVVATDNGVPIASLSCASGVGSINCSTTSQPNFSLISLVGAGSPALAGANLSSLTIDVTAAPTFLGGPHVIAFALNQTGINVPGPNALTSTFTVNNLVGTPGPTTEATLVNGAPLSSFVFPAGTINQTQAFTVQYAPTITSDAHTYSITFTAAGQSATDTIQLVNAAPEPASLALLGVSLLGLGVVARRRTR